MGSFFLSQVLSGPTPNTFSTLSLSTNTPKKPSISISLISILSFSHKDGVVSLFYQISLHLLHHLRYSRGLHHLRRASGALHPCLPLPQLRLVAGVCQVGRSRPSIHRLSFRGRRRPGWGAGRPLPGYHLGGNHRCQRAWVGRKRLAGNRRWPEEEPGAGCQRWRDAKPVWLARGIRSVYVAAVVSHPAQWPRYVSHYQTELCSMSTVSCSPLG